MLRIVFIFSLTLALLAGLPSSAAPSESVAIEGSDGYAFRLDSSAPFESGASTSLTVTILQNGTETAGPVRLQVWAPVGDPLVFCTTSDAAAHTVETTFTLAGTYRARVALDFGPRATCADWREEVVGETTFEVRAAPARATPGAATPWTFAAVGVAAATLAAIAGRRG